MSAPLVVMPDAVGLLVTHLRTVLDDPVHATIPASRPSAFVLVRRTGGPRADLIRDSAQITLEAYGPTDKAAHDLLQLARAHVHALRGEALGNSTVYRVTEFAGPGNLPDPLSDASRYTLTVQVALRGATP